MVGLEDFDAFHKKLKEFPWDLYWKSDKSSYDVTSKLRQQAGVSRFYQQAFNAYYYYHHPDQIILGNPEELDQSIKAIKQAIREDMTRQLIEG